MKTLISLIALTLATIGAAQADPGAFNDVEDPVKEEFKEGAYTLPPLPKEENLLEFYVNATMTAKFYVDASSISVSDTDKVVRYVMVVKGSGGATNISYEGLRCDANEFRIYATGNREGNWGPSRRDDWRTFWRGAPLQKSLANLYFCPDFNPIKNADEGRYALRFGGHPLVKNRYSGG